jgi:hypothetical protein
MRNAATRKFFQVDVKILSVTSIRGAAQSLPIAIGNVTDRAVAYRSRRVGGVASVTPSAPVSTTVHQ